MNSKLLSRVGYVLFFPLCKVKGGGGWVQLYFLSSEIILKPDPILTSVMLTEGREHKKIWLNQLMLF